MAPSPQNGRDIIAVLSAEHRELEAMVHALGGPEAADVRVHRPAADRQQVEQLIIAMVGHVAVEQLHLYPAVRERVVPNGEAVADKGIRGLAQAEHLMKVLHTRSETDVGYEVKIDQLIGAIRGHIAETDGMVLPKLAGSCTPDELAELGAKVIASRRRAPTRPHPLTPNTPPFNRVLIPLVAFADRVKDTLVGRGAHH